MLLRNGSVEFFRAKSDLLDKKSSLFDLNLAQSKFACELSEGRRREIQGSFQIGFGNTLDGKRISFYISHC